MDVKTILLNHRIIDDRINLKLEQIEQLKSLATKVTMSSMGESHSKGGFSDKVGRTVARIADLEQEINDEIDKLVIQKEKIRELSALLSDPLQAEIIERKYILHEDWCDIAETLGYSSRHITRLHLKAIDTLNEILGGIELTA